MSSIALLTVEPGMLKTEGRIILAALKVFAECPLEAVSMRMIAKEANITLSSITYHFKTKENLYHETLMTVLSYMTQDIEGRWGEIEKSAQISQERAQMMLRELLSYFSDRIFGPHSSVYARIIIQEHFSPSMFYDEIYERYFKRVFDLLEILISAITGEKIGRKTALMAFAIFGQLIGFRLEREIFFKRFDIPGFSEDEAVRMKEIVIENSFKLLSCNILDNACQS